MFPYMGLKGRTKAAHHLSSAREIERGQHLQKTGVAVVHEGRFSMHDTAGSAHHPAAKHLPDALVAHAHPKHGKLRPQLLYYLQGDSRLFRSPCQVCTALMSRFLPFLLHLLQALVCTVFFSTSIATKKMIKRLERAY